jgi:uncharacterized protein (TIGR03083 family)
MDALEHCIQLGQLEAERLTQYLHALPADAWRRPSACEAWEVRDVVGHLTVVAELYAGAVSRGVHGDVSPLEGLPPAGTLERSSVLERTAQSAIARQESLGEQLLPTFIARQEQLHHILAQLGPQDWDTPCYHPAGLFPVRAFIHLRVTELALHAWDIRSALDPTAPLFAESLPVLMERVPPRVLRSFRPSAKLSTPIRYRFEVIGVVSNQSDLIVAGDQTQWAPRGSAEVNVTYRCDPETFVLLMFGRLSPEAAMTQSRLVVEGDRELVTAFGTWFKGI